MQVIYGPGNASNVLLTSQKRLIRPALAQTQGFPYPAFIDPSLRNSDSSWRVPQNGDTSPLSRTAAVFTYEGSIVPGTVMVKTTGEDACVANGASGVQPWGLLGQWIGGIFDNLGQLNEIGIWMGPDSVYDLLAPAWDDTGLANKLASATAGAPVYLYAGTDGRLALTAADGGTAANGSTPVARVLNRWSPARLTIQLVV